MVTAERPPDAPGVPPVLSRFEARALLEARALGAETTSSSLDLGLTKVALRLGEQGVLLPDGLRLGWQDVVAIEESELVCFRVTAAGLEPIRGYSEHTHRTYQLMPTETSPALLVSGFVMHRIRDVGPAEGAHEMVRALSPIRGRLLDTATGLGYAAIEAARFADEVVTMELDPMAQEMARQNPWSARLFVDPKITRLLGDSSRLIEGQASGSFSCILHDPPAINLAGELYAESFYAQMLRVLGASGRLFHYIGDPGSDSGARVTKGVIKRLSSAGFRRVVPKPKAFGVLAYK